MTRPISITDLGPDAARQAAAQIAAQHALEDKPRKYRNAPIMLDGIRFASKSEAARWRELRLLEQSGRIRNLVRQMKLPLVVNGRKIAIYIADFGYLEGDRQVVEEHKGVWSKDAKLKVALAEALYGMTIRITGAAA